MPGVRTYSQSREDVCIAQHFRHRRDGFFVEVGAWDGIRLSNTLLLEREYGWRGVLVEADPRQAALCRKNRPGAHVVSAAATDPESAGTTMTMTTVEGLEAFSSIRLSNRALQHIDKKRRRKPEIQLGTVQTVGRTLDTILADAGAPQNFEFLSIDVEGHELAVLRGLSLGFIWTPRVVLIESPDPLPDPRVVMMFSRGGYRYVRCIGGWNHWYEPAPPLGVFAGLLRLTMDSARRFSKSLLSSARSVAVAAVKRRTARGSLP